MANILPNGKTQFCDSTGKPLAGGSVTFYAQGTSTPKNTWQDAAATVLNNNPVVLDASGSAAIYGSGDYRQVVKDSLGNQIWDQNTSDGYTGMTSSISAVFSASGGSSLVGFLQAGSGAVARTAQAKMRDIVSPLDFGAVADGTTDDAVALAAAAATGKAIDLGGKSYKTTVAIAVTNSVFNGTLVPTSSILTNVLTYTGTGARFFGLTFTGGSTIVATAITATATSSKFFIHDNNFSTFKNGGIAVQSGATGFFITGNTLDACSAISSGAQYGAINCNGVDGVVSGNTLTNCTQTGISSFAVTNNRYFNNKISGDGVAIASGGVIIDGLSSGCVITGNVVRNVAVEGIQISGNATSYLGANQKHTISNNVLIECAYSGITIYSADAGGVASVVITGNYIQKAATTNSGIQLDKATDCVVSGNTIIGYNIGIDPINTALRINCIGNQLETQGSIGIKAWASGSNITGNNVYGTKAASTGIIFNASTTAGDILIADNVIQQCLVGVSGVFTASASVFVKDNHFIGNTTHQSYTGSTPSSSTGNTFNDIVFNGTATLVAGAKTISNGYVAAGEKIRLFRVTDGGTTGALYYDGITATTSFVIRSTSATDTSVIGWEFVR